MKDAVSETDLLEYKEMLLRFPNVVPLKADLSEFRGWLRVCGRSLPVVVRCPPGPHRQIKVTSSNGLVEDLWRQLEKETPELAEKIARMQQPSVYLDELVSALNRLGARRKISPVADFITPGGCRTTKAKAFRQLLDQLTSHIGVEQLKAVDEHCVTFTYREMDMKYNMSDGRIESASIPQELLSKTPSLVRPRGAVDAFAAFKDLVDKLEPFYQSLKSLDSSCWIVDPSDLRQLYRRVALEDSLALQITFADPLHLGKPPLLDLLGCPSSGKGLREILRRAEWCRRWDPHHDILENLRLTLGNELRLVSSQEDSEVDMTCAICYAYRLGEEIPEVFCATGACRRAYHSECFRSWLLQWTAEQGAARAAPAISGASIAPCVYCEQPIAMLSTPMATSSTTGSSS